MMELVVAQWENAIQELAHVNVKFSLNSALQSVLKHIIFAEHAIFNFRSKLDLS